MKLFVWMYEIPLGKLPEGCNMPGEVVSAELNGTERGYPDS
jgi:hypothetical protein